MRHASFFSGVGGLDLGFERAGIKTVSICEIDPYASSVLAERFPDAPNLGSITEINANDIPEADIWSGGFPCQDLSVAGKRAGFAGKRSSLAFTFLDLVEQRRPRWIVLENVPGLFSSNKGADFARLLYEMEQLRYGVAWRTLDARYFGVAQRRRRVFLVGSLGSDRAGEVLFECEGCERHPSPRLASWQGAAAGAPDGSGIAGALTRRFSKGVNSTIDEPRIVSTLQARMGKGRGPSVNTDEAAGGQLVIVGSEANADGVRAANGVARRMDDQQVVDTFGAETHRALQARDWKVGVSNQDIGQEGYLVGYQTRVDEKNDNFSLNEAYVANSLSDLWPSDTSHRSMTPIAPKENIISFPSAYSMQPSSFNDVSDPLTLSAGAPAVFRKAAAFKAGNSASARSIGYEEEVSPALEAGGGGNNKPTVLIGTSYDGFNQKIEQDGAHRTLRIGRDSSDFVIAPFGEPDESLLPIGLDSHRYRCAGNGVVANVAEWIGIRIMAADVLD